MIFSQHFSSDFQQGLVHRWRVCRELLHSLSHLLHCRTLKRQCCVNDLLITFTESPAQSDIDPFLFPAVAFLCPAFIADCPICNAGRGPETLFHREPCSLCPPTLVAVDHSFFFYYWSITLMSSQVSFFDFSMFVSYSLSCSSSPSNCLSAL